MHKNYVDLLANAFTVVHRICISDFFERVIANIGLVKKPLEPTGPPAEWAFHSVLKSNEEGNIFGGFVSVKPSVQ